MVSFPARNVCPRCFADGQQTSVLLANEGCIYSYTTVHLAPSGRHTPYTLAYVDLDDGVRVLAQIRGVSDTQQLIGRRVCLVLEDAPKREAASGVAYAFKLTDMTEERRP